MKEFKQVIILGIPGRKRDNLVILLRLVVGNIEIQTTSRCQKVIEFLINEEPALVLIDHSIPIEEIILSEQTIREKNSEVRLLLMLSYPQQRDPYLAIKSDGVIYDGFSLTTLKQIIASLTKDPINTRLNNIGE